MWFKIGPKQLTVQGLIARLKESAYDDDLNVIIPIARELGQRGGEKETVPGLIELLKDPNPNVCFAAALALSETGEDGKSAESALIETAIKYKDKDYRVRWEAWSALGKIQLASCLRQESQNLLKKPSPE